MTKIPKAPFTVRPLNKILREFPHFTPKWKKGTGDQVLINLGFGELRHVVVCDKTGKPLWDQPVHIEPVGAITVPVTREGKIRLQKQFRPVVLPLCIKPKFPEVFPEDCWGRWFLEVPRGFPIRGESPDKAAIRETMEEAQSPILEIIQLGEVNANSTFFNHMIPVFLARVDESFEGEFPEDVNEKVLKGDDINPEEVKRLIAGGEIQDALTLAALNLYFCAQ